MMSKLERADLYRGIPLRKVELEAKALVLMPGGLVKEKTTDNPSKLFMGRGEEILGEKIPTAMSSPCV